MLPYQSPIQTFSLLNKTNLISSYQTKPLISLSNPSICYLNKPNHPYPYQTQPTISLLNPTTHFLTKPNHNLLYPHQSIYILPLYNPFCPIQTQQSISSLTQPYISSPNPTNLIYLYITNPAVQLLKNQPFCFTNYNYILTKPNLISQKSEVSLLSTKPTFPIIIKFTFLPAGKPLPSFPSL